MSLGLPLAIVLALAGVVIATLSSRLMVASAVAIAQRARVPQMVIGLTLLSVGTDLPEIANSLISSYRGQGDINVGDSYGSVFTQLTLGLGAMLMVRAVDIPRRAPLIQLLIALAGIGIGAALLADGQFARVDAAVLVALFVVAVGFAFSGADEEPASHVAAKSSLVAKVATMAVATAGVIVGATMLVEGVMTTAELVGVPPIVLSFLGAALGTSAPELVVSVTAARRGNGQLAAGNIVGASVADSTVSLALGPLLFPTAVSSGPALVAASIAAGSALLVVAVIASGRTGRIAGAGLLAAYVAGAVLTLRGA